MFVNEANAVHDVGQDEILRGGWQPPLGPI